MSPKSVPFIVRVDEDEVRKTMARILIPLLRTITLLWFLAAFNFLCLAGWQFSYSPAWHGWLSLATVCIFVCYGVAAARRWDRARRMLGLES